LIEINSKSSEHYATENIYKLADENDYLKQELEKSKAEQM